MDGCTNQVKLVSTWGGDEQHAAAAWTSSGGMTEERKARIPALLKMLADNAHGTPFEHSALEFQIVADVASHIHILKHRIGVATNGESARYRELVEDKLYVPVDWPLERQLRYLEWAQDAQQRYHEELCELEPLLGRKRAKESARYYLPYGSQITLMSTFNFRSWEHFIGLRWSEHAQLEIREIAGKMLELVRETGDFQHSLAAFGY